ncbi:MAG: efflux RND transporter periplasmic adaptor subunit, partial [Gammaproteobacteria bacterium]
CFHPPWSVRNHWLVALCLLVAAWLMACSDPASPAGGQNAAAQPPPTPVTVIEVQPQRVELERDYAGRAYGARTVEVRARVAGIVQQRRFREGEVVEQGQSLFLISPRPYEIARKRAQAQLENRRAEQRQAEREWRRAERLFETKAISERDRDDALSALEIARAQTALAEAELAASELDVSYTEVRAPLDGVTSLERVPEGSLIAVGDLLTTVTELDPIHVRFAIPEHDVFTQRRARGAMTQRATDDEAAVRSRAVLILPEGEIYEHAGQVDFTDSSIDPATGTVTLRAVFDNPEQLLTPGQFVRVRLRTATLDAAMLVPEKAITDNQRGPMVYVVEDGNKVSARPVTLGPATAAGQVIESGLRAGEQVIVEGTGQVREGATVDVRTDSDRSTERDAPSPGGSENAEDAGT